MIINVSSECNQLKLDFDLLQIFSKTLPEF